MLQAEPAVTSGEDGAQLSVEERAKRNAEKRKKALAGAGASGGSRDPAAIYGALMATNDKDHDGKLTAGELPERMRSRFADMDKNGDKFIDAAEVQLALAAAIERAKARAAAGGGG